jgi:hypothetical protein
MSVFCIKNKLFLCFGYVLFSFLLSPSPRAAPLLHAPPLRRRLTNVCRRLTGVRRRLTDVCRRLTGVRWPHIGILVLQTALANREGRVGIGAEPRTPNAAHRKDLPNEPFFLGRPMHKEVRIPFHEISPTPLGMFYIHTFHQGCVRVSPIEHGYIPRFFWMVADNVPGDCRVVGQEIPVPWLLWMVADDVPGYVWIFTHPIPIPLFLWVCLIKNMDYIDYCYFSYFKRI